MLKNINIQRLKPCEVIVVDDNSTDNTYAVSRELGTKVIRNDVNLGLAKSLNRGIRASKGNIVVTLHADCQPADETWLENLVKWFKDPTIGAVTSRVIEKFSEGANLVDKMWASLDLPPKEPEVWREVAFFTDKCDAYRRDVLEDLNLFDERFISTNEDVDLSLKMRKAGYRITKDPDSRVFKFRSSAGGSIVKYFRKMLSYSVPRPLIFWRYGVPWGLGDIGVKHFFNLLLLLLSALYLLPFFDVFFVLLMLLFLAIYRPSHLYAKDVGIQFLSGYTALSITQYIPFLPLTMPMRIPFAIDLGIIFHYLITAMMSAKTVYQIDGKITTFIMSSLIYFIRNFVFGIGFLIGIIKLALGRRL